MLNAKEILEEGLIILDNAQGKPAQVGYDLSIKSISKLKGGGKVLKDKTIVNKLDEVSFNESDNGNFRLARAVSKLSTSRYNSRQSRYV